MCEPTDQIETVFIKVENTTDDFLKEGETTETRKIPKKSKGGRCSVASCHNYFHEPKAFYTFPKDPKLRKIWVSKCKREPTFKPNFAKICCDHFTPDQFEDDIQARIMGIKRHRKLKPGAIPTENLGKSLTSQKEKVQTACRKESDTKNDSKQESPMSQP